MIQLENCVKYFNNLILYKPSAFSFLTASFSQRGPVGRVHLARVSGMVAAPMTPERKKQILQIITGFGGLLAALGTLPVDSANLPLPPEWRPYLISVGFFALTARSWLQFAADLIDNGQIDGSHNPDKKP